MLKENQTENKQDINLKHCELLFDTLKLELKHCILNKSCNSKDTGRRTDDEKTKQACSTKMNRLKIHEQGKLLAD